MKILFVCGSRGEWGYIRPVIDECRQRGLEYSICATNMLLLAQYGSLVDDLEAEGYVVSDKIFMSLEGHTRTTMAKSLGIYLSSFVDVLASRQPDWVVLAGDRGEQLMSAVAAAYSYVPVAHIQAGERSGNIDGVARHAIGKFVHLHFASNEDAAERLRRLGEEEFRIHNVGAPQLDDLVAGRVSSLEDLRSRYAMDLSQAPILVAQHPVTEEYEEVDEQIAATCRALAELEQEKIWILPNNDAGADRIRHGVLRARAARTHIFNNLPRADYLGFLKHCACIVGNSSAALIEAPTFGIPAVNLGRRQADRVRGDNVIEAPLDEDSIKKAIATALSPEFKASLEGIRNPYGDGRSSARILDILSSTPATDHFLIKALTY